MSKRLIIGLMSGTSVDAIDAALVEITGKPGQYRARILAHQELGWPRALRSRLLAVMMPAQTSTQEICELNFLVARQFAAAVQKLLTHANLSPDKITALASHGQTICHLPPRQGRATKSGSTLQIGDASVLATLTGIPTVGNFRPADMAAGGQGAPLVPWADHALLAHPKRTRCVQNIGGIANVTYIPSLHTHAESGTFITPRSQSTRQLQARRPMLAFDTGPGNMLLDAVISIATRGRRIFDRNGRLADAGVIDQPLFRDLQAHPYFLRRPPKSTGREEFGMSFARHLMASLKPRKLKIENLLHTLTRLTAWSIADAYRRFLPRMPDEVILCGGGAHNPVLVAMLRDELGGEIALHPIDDFGIPNKAKEAASFALLAAATLDGVPSNIPTVTGAARPVVLGVVARP